MAEAVADRGGLGSALRKAHWRIIPLLAICYLVAYIDRANISFAAESMNRDLHFSPHVYGLGAGLFFLSYGVCQLPASKLLLWFGARRGLALIMFAWGLVAAGTMFIRARPGFYGMRLLLGVAEAGYIPGVLYYMTAWFPKAQRGRAISLFYLSYPLSLAVMGAAAGTLLNLNGRMGLRGWQWLFLVEGVPAVLLSAWVWWALPDDPATTEWLEEGERLALESELAEESSLTSSMRKRGSLRDVLADRRVWNICLFYFCISCLGYGVSFFLPVMLRSLTQWTPQRVGFVIAAESFLAAAAMVAVASHSDKTEEHAWHVLIPVMAMGMCLLLAALHMRGMVAVIELLLVMILYTSMLGPLLVLVTMIRPGEDVALTVATFNMCGVFGGFAGPYWMGWMREITGGYAAGVGSIAALCAIGVVFMLRLMRQRQREVVARA